MGIPRFYSWIRRKGYKGVLRRGVPKYVSSLSLDANGIIHKCAQLVYAYGEGNDPVRRKLVEKADPKYLEAEFHNAVSTKLQEILAQVRPNEIFVIAIDGVAPQAKISQQRQRRFRAAMETTEKMVFSGNSITPGTDFMIRLDNFLQRWIISYQATLPPKVIYSSHMVPGEGEQKILDLIRSGEISGNGEHVLYGMDADLIMLSMIAPIENIYLMREDINDVISINSLKYAIQEEFQSPTAIRDFVVMIFTIGNDFLPHMPSLESLSESIEILTKVYIETGRSLTTDNDLDWAGISIFLTNLAKEEPNLLKSEASRDVKYPSRMIKVATKRLETIEEGDQMRIGKKISFITKFDYNIFRGAWYQNEFVPKGSNFSVFKTIMPEYNFGLTTNKIVEMSKQYLIGMAWVYNYYTKGSSFINTEYVYRYHHTPLLTDLSLVLNQIGKIDGYLAKPNQIVLNPIHQLLSVLPIKSKNLLPPEITHLMSKNSPIADMYPETAIIERDGKNAEWQGIVLIPFVDTERVINAVNTTTMFSYERAKLYSQANNIVLKRDPALIEIEQSIQKQRRSIEEEKMKRFGGRGRGGYNQNRGGYNQNRGGQYNQNRGGYNQNRGGQYNQNRGGGQYKQNIGGGKYKQNKGHNRTPQYTQPSRDYKGQRVDEQKNQWKIRTTIL